MLFFLGRREKKGFSSSLRTDTHSDKSKTRSAEKERTRGVYGKNMENVILTSHYAHINMFLFLILKGICLWGKGYEYFIRFNVNDIL